MRKEIENTTSTSRENRVACGPGVYMPALNVVAMQARSNRTRARF